MGGGVPAGFVCGLGGCHGGEFFRAEGGRRKFCCAGGGSSRDPAEPQQKISEIETASGTMQATAAAINGGAPVIELIRHYMKAAGTNAARAHEAVYEAGRWMAAQLGGAPPAATPERFDGSGKIKKAWLDKLWLRVAGLAETMATPAGPNAYVNACLEAEEAAGGDRFGEFIVCAPGVDYRGRVAGGAREGDLRVLPCGRPAARAVVDGPHEPTLPTRIALWRRLNPLFGRHASPSAVGPPPPPNVR